MTRTISGESHRPGRIEVVCGSMFSGKTEELIRRMKRAKFAKQRVEIFKPRIDTRYSDVDVVSHDQNAIKSTPVESSSTILLLASDIDVVGIDEAQFQTTDLLTCATSLPTEASASSLQVWIWTSKAFLSVRCRHYVRLPMMSQRCMLSV